MTSLERILMDANRADPRRIAEEAIGERPPGSIPAAVKEHASGPTDRDIRQQARSVGPHASVAEKTAEAVGERVGDAYAYRHVSSEEVQRRSRIATPRRGHRLEFSLTDPPLALLVAFVVGYGAALMLHRR
jgi:hypothetical protein